MGLDFRESNAQWSYGGFNSFRRRLATQIGINLDDMQCFGGTIPWKTVKDPIVPFLNHSNCEGTMTPEAMKKVAPRIKALVKDWEDGHDKNNALELAADMLRLSKKNKRLHFC
jgi:hypothetical protein